MYQVVWKKGLQKVHDNVIFPTIQEAQTYANIESCQSDSIGWSYQVVRCKKAIRFEYSS